LGAVDDVTAGNLAGGGPQAGHVRARAGLGDPERPDPLALDPGDDPALALLGGPEVEHGRHRDLGMGVEAGGDAAGSAGPGELLDPDRVVEQVAALPAVALRKLEPQEAELAAALEQLPRELASLLPPVDVRGDLGGDEAADALAQLLVLLGERGQDRARPRVLDDRSVHPAPSIAGAGGRMPAILMLWTSSPIRSSPPIAR